MIGEIGVGNSRFFWGLLWSLAGGLMFSQPGELPGQTEADRWNQAVRRLEHPDFAVRQAADHELRDGGAETLPVLLAALKSPSLEIAWRVKALLESYAVQHADPASIQRIVEALAHVPGPLRSEMAEAGQELAGQWRERRSQLALQQIQAKGGSVIVSSGGGVALGNPQIFLQNGIVQARIVQVEVAPGRVIQVGGLELGDGVEIIDEVLEEEPVTFEGTFPDDLGEELSSSSPSGDLDRGSESQASPFGDRPWPSLNPDVWQASLERLEWQVETQSASGDQVAQMPEQLNRDNRMAQLASGFAPQAAPLPPWLSEAQQPPGYRIISPLAALPDRPQRQVILNGQWQGTVEDWSLLARVDGLVYLQLNGLQLGPSETAVLSELPHLEYLSLNRTRVDLEMLTRLLSQRRELRIEALGRAKMGIYNGAPEGERDGCWVGNVVPSSPASAAGLQLGDRIVSIDGQPIVSFQHLQVFVSQCEPEQTVEMVVERRDERMHVTLTLDRRD